jgi:capsular polysaccharide biosynthesis protein
MDLRRSISLLRRRKRLVASAIALGIAAGAVFAVLSPPTVSARTLVVLPGAAPNEATEVVIASSNPVLQGALPYVTPTMTLAKLREEVQVEDLSTNILQITVQARNATAAETNATAVTNSYIAYIGSTASPVGRLTVRVLQAANTASGTSPVIRWLTSALIGGLGGALIGIITALATARRDRRLRTRDAIANSIGVPVLASLPVAHPSSTGEWWQLLNSYQPRPVYAWRLRKTLQHLMLAGVDLSGSKSSSVTVLSLATDPRALALGPQLAAFAASQGVDTCLVAGQDQDAQVTATLRTACSTMPRGGAKLQVTVADDDDTTPPDGAAFTVVVAVIDGQQPRTAEIMHTTVTVLGVSAGAATADQLALAAVTAASDGRDITGILVADPDPEDTTTGRAPQFVRPGKNEVPSEHVTGLTTEVRQ